MTDVVSPAHDEQHFGLVGEHVAVEASPHVARQVARDAGVMEQAQMGILGIQA